MPELDGSGALTLRRQGLHGQLMVKGTTKSFAMNFLRDEKHYPTAGSSKFICTEVDGYPLLAIGWQDQTLKTLISTCGTCLEGSPHVKQQTKWSGANETTTITTSVRRPLAYERYFAYAHLIDVNNHYRQGLLAIEAAWSTTLWPSRIYSTIFGMWTTDAYLAWCYVRPESQLGIREFVENVVALHFQRLHVKRSARASRSDADGEEKDCDIQKLSDHPKYKSKPPKSRRCQRRCSRCTALCTFYCVTCSSEDNIIAICGTSSARRAKCLFAHFGDAT